MSDQSPIAKLFQKWLMASYVYYHLNRNVMLDTTYDKIAKLLEKEWDTFEHPHKYLVDKGNLSVTSLYNLKEKDYPRIVVCAANLWLDDIETGKREIK